LFSPAASLTYLFRSDLILFFASKLLLLLNFYLIFSRLPKKLLARVKVTIVGCDGRGFITFFYLFTRFNQRLDDIVGRSNLHQYYQVWAGYRQARFLDFLWA